MDITCLLVHLFPFVSCLTPVYQYISSRRSFYHTRKSIKRTSFFLVVHTLDGSFHMFRTHLSFSICLKIIHLVLSSCKTKTKREIYVCKDLKTEVHYPKHTNVPAHGIGIQLHKLHHKKSQRLGEDVDLLDH